MSRGVLSGMAMGGVVATVAAIGLSFFVDPPDMPRPEAVTLGVPAGSEFNKARKDEQAKLPAGEPAPQAIRVRPVEAPAPDDLMSLGSIDTRPAAVPQTGDQPTSELPAPGDASVPPSVSPERERPVARAETGDVPAVPEPESKMSISVDPAQPGAPGTETEEPEFSLTDEAGARAPLVQSQAPVEPVLSDPVNDLNTVLQTTDKQAKKPPSNVISGARTEPGMDELEIRVDPAPAQPGGPAATPAPGADDDASDASEPAAPGVNGHAAGQQQEDAGSEAVGTLPEMRESETQTEAQDDAPVIAIGKPATRLTDRTDRIATGGLPTIGATSSPPTQAETAEIDSVTATDGPPFVRFKKRYEASENKPKIAIVLIDEPGADVGMEALSTFPYPLTFAVDTSLPGAADRMALYRAAGFEVLAMVDLPETAGAGDVEVAMQVLLARVPEAVGVMEAPGDGIQSSREIVTQVTEILANSGHGLLLYPNRLDTARKLASKAGVPAASIFRDFDAQGENPRVIRRFLNYAVLRAGSDETGVVMVGRLRPDTVTALLLWALEGRAREIDLTPVSAIMQPQHDEG